MAKFLEQLFNKLGRNLLVTITQKSGRNGTVSLTARTLGTPETHTITGETFSQAIENSRKNLLIAARKARKKFEAEHALNQVSIPSATSNRVTITTTKTRAGQLMNAFKVARAERLDKFQIRINEIKQIPRTRVSIRNPLPSHLPPTFRRG